MVPVPVDLSKLNYAVKNGVVKKAVYGKSAEKGNNIDTSRFISRTKYDADKSELEKKNPETSELVEKLDCNAKIIGIKSKIPSISSLATNAALTAVKSKIPDVSTLVKKTDYNTKINENETKFTNHNYDKYITKPKSNKLTAEDFAARLKQVNLVTKTDFDDNLKILNKKLTQTKKKICLLNLNLKS